MYSSEFDAQVGPVAVFVFADATEEVQRSTVRSRPLGNE